MQRKPLAVRVALVFPRLFDAAVEKLASSHPLDEGGRYYVWARYCQIHQDPTRRELAQRFARALGLKGLGPGLAPASE